MRAYELMVILSPRLRTVVEPSLSSSRSSPTGGSIDNVDIWAVAVWHTRSRRSPRVSYAVVNFTATPRPRPELDRVLNLNESVMRTKIIRPEDQKISSK